MPFPCGASCEAVEPIGLPPPTGPQSPQACPVAETLRDGFRWMEHQLHVAQQMIGALQAPLQPLELDDLADAVETCTISTAFAGTGGAENTFHSCSRCISHFTQRRDLKIKSLWCIEWFAESKLELQMLPHPSECSFTDMTQCISDNVRLLLIKRATTMNYEDLEKIFRNKNIVKHTMMCGSHHKECMVRRATVHIAGTECVTWSSQGTGMGLSGPKVLAYLAWKAQC